MRVFTSKWISTPECVYLLGGRTRPFFSLKLRHTPSVKAFINFTPPGPVCLSALEVSAPPSFPAKPLGGNCPPKNDRQAAWLRAGCARSHIWPCQRLQRNVSTSDPHPVTHPVSLLLPLSGVFILLSCSARQTPSQCKSQESLHTLEVRTSYSLDSVALKGHCELQCLNSFQTVLVLPEKPPPTA